MLLPHVRDGTFRDLQSSGNLRLIDDMEARRLLFDCYWGIARWQEGHFEGMLDRARTLRDYLDVSPEAGSSGRRAGDP